MAEIVRVKSYDEVYDFEKVYVVLERSADGALYYALRGLYQSSGYGYCGIFMMDRQPDRLLDIADYLNDMRTEPCPSLLPIDCTVGSDIDSLVREYMAKRSQPDPEDA